jgi:hypothetical protein
VDSRVIRPCPNLVICFASKHAIRRRAGDAAHEMDCIGSDESNLMGSLQMARSGVGGRDLRRSRTQPEVEQAI